VGAPRIIVSGSTVAISRRAVMRKAFLGAWDARVEQAWLYALADAQRVHDVAVHHGVRCVSHHHVEVTAAGANLPEFLHRFHRDVSCALNTLLAMERYDSPRTLFDGRQAHVMQLVDDSAQLRHLLYSHLNPVAAGLVAKPEQMPGRTLGFDDWLGDGVVVKRPEFYFGKNRPEELRLKLTPPLRLLASFGGDVKTLVYHLRRLTDDGCRALRAARTRPVMGAEALRRMHPWAEPKTLAESGGKRVPSFKVGALGDEGRDRRRRCAQEVTAFRSRYRETRRCRLQGEDAVFPHGSYGPRAYYAAPVEPEATPDAILTLDGPRSLEEALGDLEAPTRERRNELLDAAREAQRGEAAEQLLEEQLDFEPGAPFHGHAPAEGERMPAETRHRFARHRDVTDNDPHARRLVIERDRRLGRPPGDTGPPR